MVKILQYRRKREKRTDYKKRLHLLKGRTLRVTIRKSLKYISLQIIEYDPLGDIILVSANSKELTKYGWNGNTKNTPAAYLSGLLLGKKAREKKITKGIIDLGQYTTTKGNKLFAAVKGVIDSGISIPASTTIFPDDKRIQGEHISTASKESFVKVKEALLL